MGSPITFSSFNQIDFGVVLNAIMQQESQPLRALQSQQTALQATDSAFEQLTGKLKTLQSTASALGGTSALSQYSATSSDSLAVSVTSTGAGVAGRYDVVVNELARAQVLVSSATVPDSNATIVATGGTLTIGGVAVALSGPVTLSQLVNQINALSAVPAAAAIVETSPGAFRLVLTGKATGTTHAFTVASALTGSLVTFADGNGDGVSGDSAGDNAVQATNAAVLINNILVTSASNTLTSGIPGVTVTLLKKDATKTITITVDHDQESLADRANRFASAYNDLVKFADDQAAAVRNGTAGTLGRDELLRSIRQALRSAIAATYGTGTYKRLAEVGLGFNRAGQITVDQNALAEASQNDAAALEALFAGGGSGAFASVSTLITAYTQSGGFVPGARSRVSDELSRLGKRIDDMQARLALRRSALQREFIAADQAMSRLNGQAQALASFKTNLVNNAP